MIRTMLRTNDTDDNPDCKASYDDLVYLSNLYINIDAITTSQAQRRDQLLYYLIKKNKPKLLDIRYFKALFKQHCQEAKDIKELNKFHNFANEKECTRVIDHIEAITGPYKEDLMPKIPVVTRPKAQSPSTAPAFSLHVQSLSKISSTRRSNSSPNGAQSPSTASAFSTPVKESPPPPSPITLQLLNAPANSMTSTSGFKGKNQQTKSLLQA